MDIPFCCVILYMAAKPYRSNEHSKNMYSINLGFIPIKDGLIPHDHLCKIMSVLVVAMIESGNLTAKRNKSSERD